MLDSGKARQAYDFLVSVRPEIANYSTLPVGLEGLMMQLASIRLLTGFESFEVREKAWLHMISHWETLGFRWQDPKNRNLTDNYIFTGDIPAAKDSYVFRLNMPMARNLNRHKRFSKTIYAPLCEDPGVAARLSQLDMEFAQLREQVSEMMLEPEWNQ